MQAGTWAPGTVHFERRRSSLGGGQGAPHGHEVSARQPHVGSRGLGRARAHGSVTREMYPIAQATSPQPVAATPSAARRKAVRPVAAATDRARRPHEALIGSAESNHQAIGDATDARTNAPVEQWTSASAVLKTRA
jgi:hypothetical protein